MLPFLIHFKLKGNTLIRSKILIFCRSPRKRRSRSRSGSRKRKHRKRSRSRSRERKRKSSRSYSSERRAREREKERQKKGLPPVRSKTLSGEWHPCVRLPQSQCWKLVHYLVQQTCCRDAGAWLRCSAGNPGKVCDSCNRKGTPVDSRLSSLANLVSSRPAKEYASKPNTTTKKAQDSF